MKLRPGDKISYEVFYLEMANQLNTDWPEPPPGDIFVLHSDKPTSEYFFDLYKRVGEKYEWTDKYKVPLKEIEIFLSHTSVKMFTFFKNGRTAGFFILDRRVVGICDLSYFGLVPEAIGFGYGEYLLKFAVQEGWKEKNTQILTVNTNTLDHSNALPLYKKVGFRVKRIEKETRKLTKPRSENNN